MGAARAAGALSRIVLRAVSSEYAHGYAATQPGQEVTGPLRLRLLPYGENSWRRADGCYHGRASADAHSRKDHPRMDLRLAQKSASVLRHCDYAKFSA